MLGARNLVSLVLRREATEICILLLIFKACNGWYGVTIDIDLHGRRRIFVFFFGRRLGFREGIVRFWLVFFFFAVEQAARRV